MLHYLYLLMLAAFLTQPKASASPGELRFLLVEDGLPRADIVLPPKATEAEQQAASLLQDWLRAMSGAELPITVAATWPQSRAVNVGRVTRLPEWSAKVEEEEVFCLFRNDHLVLAGGGDRGTLYAAITFLEHLGCDWPMPGTENQVIPRQSTLAVSRLLNLHEQPGFKYRWQYAEGDWGLWMRCNAGYGTITGGSHRLWSGHAHRYLIPPEEHFEIHPTWFALVQGQRQPNQLCYTNPELQEAITAKVLALAAQGRYEVIGLSPNDGYGFCECEACCALGNPLSERVIWFVNQIVQRVRKQYSDQLFLCYAYAPYDDAPKVNRPDENLIIQFCPWLRCRSHPYGLDSCTRSVRTYQQFTGWAKITHHLWLYEYGAYTWSCPYPNLQKTARDFRFFATQGAEGWFRDICFADWWTEGINQYVDCRLAWNPQAEADELIADYCRLFGTAQTPLVEYFQILEKAMQKADCIFITPNGDLPKIFAPEVLVQARVLMNKALALVRDDTQQVQARVRKLDLGLQYTEKRLQQLQAWSQLQTQPSPEARQRAAQSTEDLLTFLPQLEGIVHSEQAAGYARKLQEALEFDLTNLPPGDFSYMDQCDRNNTRALMDAERATGLFPGTWYLMQRPRSDAELIYRISAPRGHTLQRLRLRVETSALAQAPLRIEVRPAHGTVQVVYDEEVSGGWREIDLTSQVAGQPFCRLRLSRRNPTDREQTFVGAIGFSGQVE